MSFSCEGVANPLAMRVYLGKVAKLVGYFKLNQRISENPGTGIPRKSIKRKEPLLPNSFNFVRINRQYGNRRPFDHISSYTSEKNILQSLSAVRSHHHQVNFFRVNGF